MFEYILREIKEMCDNFVEKKFYWVLNTIHKYFHRKSSLNKWLLYSVEWVRIQNISGWTNPHRKLTTLLQVTNAEHAFYHCYWWRCGSLIFTFQHFHNNFVQCPFWFEVFTIDLFSALIHLNLFHQDEWIIRANSYGSMSLT